VAFLFLQRLDVALLDFEENFLLDQDLLLLPISLEQLLVELVSNQLLLVELLLSLFLLLNF